MFHDMFFVRFCCEREKRLGGNSNKEIREHQFFLGVDWEYIRFVSESVIVAYFKILQ